MEGLVIFNDIANLQIKLYKNINVFFSNFIIYCVYIHIYFYNNFKIIKYKDIKIKLNIIIFLKFKDIFILQYYIYSIQ